MALEKCWFCDKDIKKGTGTIYVKSDGTMIHFCSSKCKKSYNLGRHPKKIRWAKKVKKVVTKNPKKINRK